MFVQVLEAAGRRAPYDESERQPHSPKPTCLCGCLTGRLCLCFLLLLAVMRPLAPNKWHDRRAVPAVFCGVDIKYHEPRLAFKQQLPLRAVRRKDSKNNFGNTPRKGELLYQPSPLPLAAATRLNDLLAAFQRVFQEPKLARWQLDHENKRLFKPTCSNQAWEEIDQTCVAELLHAAGLGHLHSFVDVGSGLGKLVLVAATVIEVGAAWGVELSPSRAQEAVRAADRLLTEGHLTAAERSRVRLVQGNCVDGLPAEALAATHVLFGIRRMGKLPAGARHVAEVFVDKLSQSPLLSGEPRVIWSVGKRLLPRAGLVHTRASWVGAEWVEGRDLLVHEYALHAVGDDHDGDYM